MSRTDKTRPYAVKAAELPPHAVIHWRREFGCGRHCKTYGAYAKAEDRTARRERKRHARGWRHDYVDES